MDNYIGKKPTNRVRGRPLRVPLDEVPIRSSSVRRKRKGFSYSTAPFIVVPGKQQEQVFGVD